MEFYLKPSRCAFGHGQLANSCSLSQRLSDGLLRHLQLVQDAAACLVTGARRCDHITLVLRQLHWLPVRQRVMFKIAGLVYQSLVGAAPTYPADDCHLLLDVGCRWLQSSSNKSGSCSCLKLIINLVIGVPRLPDLNCGTIFHPDYSIWDCP